MSNNYKNFASQYKLSFLKYNGISVKQVPFQLDLCVYMCESKFPKISRELKNRQYMSKMSCKINKRSLNFKRQNVFI